MGRRFAYVNEAERQPAGVTELNCDLLIFQVEWLTSVQLNPRADRQRSGGLVPRHEGEGIATWSWHRRTIVSVDNADATELLQLVHVDTRLSMSSRARGDTDCPCPLAIDWSGDTQTASRTPNGRPRPAQR